MFVEHETKQGETTSQERRDRHQPDSRILGHVVQCDGARATVAAYADEKDGTTSGLWTVGRMVSINLGTARTVGLVYAIERQTQVWQEGDQNPISVYVELVGEVHDVDGRPVFDRGITIYPHIGAVTHRIRGTDLAAVYDLGGRRAVEIGQLSQDAAISARIAVDETLNRHFAVVGTTGVGKSTAVALLLRKAIESRPDLRVLLLDPHNEFAAAFPDHAVRINSSSLDLPFWLFRLEELVEVLYRGREPIAEEVELLREIIPYAKHLYRNPSGGVFLRRQGDSSGITADTPIPYRMADVLKQIDERMGLLESKHDRPVYKTLKTRIEAALNDPRYRFMFASRLIEDTIHETIGRIFRVPHEGRPITCFELAGMPSEVVNSVCSVLARLAFDLALWSNGRLKLLVMCEEAHRYMPADARHGFTPTRYAMSRIAKEGRKYGCYLGVVTQRPGELDPTILSQCSTVFAMRLANEQDQGIIRSAIADSSASMLSFLSSMGQREAIAFGEGVATTMRMKFAELDPKYIPGAAGKDIVEGMADEEGDIDLADVVSKLRDVARPAAAEKSAAAGLGLPIEQDLQPGDPGYRKSASEPYGRRQTDDTGFRRLYD